MVGHLVGSSAIGVSVTGVAALTQSEPGLRRTRNSAPVSPQRGCSLTASALQPKSVLASSDALRLREFAQLFIIGAFMLLNPVLALLAAIAVEIASDILLQAGGPTLAPWVILSAPRRARSPENTAHCGAAPFARFGLQSGYAHFSSRIWRQFLILINGFSSRLSRSTGVRTLAAARSAETRRPRSGAPEPTLISLSGDIPAPQRRRAVA